MDIHQQEDLYAIRFMSGTKVSHDFIGDQVKTFSYKDLIARNSPAIGIPCKQNGLVVIDVDVISDQHKHDGREFWTNFCVEYGMPQTYTVQTASGGYHFYFRLPPSVNPETFRPPANLAPGVDVKYRGWVGAPPTEGYTIVQGGIATIVEAPPSLLAFMTQVHSRGTDKTFDNPELGISFSAHKPFTDSQIKELKAKMSWLQSNGTLDRAEWRDGLFALKAGIDDPVLLDEMVDMWTYNQSYVEGDEVEARSIVDAADKYGPIGPGTILAILKVAARREGALALDSPWTTEEIINNSKVAYSFTKDGSIKIEPSEANASSLMAAMHPVEDLYHDIRSDIYIYKNKAYSDAELINKMIPMVQSTHAGLGLEKFRRAHISCGLDVMLSTRQIDPHTKYLEGLYWDGKPRIEQFFQTYCHVEDNAYHRKVSKNFWVALAARNMSPGCKFDSVVIIEGKEGTRKSSLVAAIGGEYTFAPSRKDIMESTDELRKMHQSIIVELPELMGLVGEKSEKVKAFLSSSYDHIRDLYARKAMRKDRGFVFVGTTNDDKYLTASMGARRFWPIKIPDHVTQLEVDGIVADRDQLFAEAIQYFRDGYRFYDMPAELLRNNVSSKVIVDPLADPIEELMKDRASTSTIEMYRSLEASGYIGRGFTPVIKRRIASSLSALGFSKAGEQWSRPIEEPDTFYGFDLKSII